MALATVPALDGLRAQAPAQAVLSGADLVRATYTKYEYLVPMRDGARLFTAVYVPKDASQKYPFLITRTPYSVSPYGVDQYPSALGPSEHFQKDGFIFVYQDARGRYMSEGEFQQVRPFNPAKGPKEVDESTDTYDTIEWLLKNVPNNNGRAGMVGISQPGFHVAASIIHSHPALKAASPQAPTADYYMGDDVYHNGAFMLGANFGFYSGFVPRGETPQPPQPALRFDPGTPDMYDFFLHTPVPLAHMNTELFGGKASYWQEIVDHTAYDEFWKKRSLWKFMDGVTCAVLNVGGWFDAEDPVGPLRTYRAVEEKNAGTPNMLVMGPWSHGGWARGAGATLGNLNFAVRTAEFFRENIQFPFFMEYLKDKPAKLPEAWMFLTGVNEFRRLDAWPPKGLQPETLYFDGSGTLSRTRPEGERQFDEYVSDPNRPVPYVGYVAPGMTRRLHDRGPAVREPADRRARLSDGASRQGHDHRRAGAGEPARLDHRDGLGFRREARRCLSERLSNPCGAGRAAGARRCGEDGRLPADGTRRAIPGEVPQRLRETGAIRPRRAGGHHLRIARCLSRVSQGASGDGPGAELVVPADRSQSPGLHGNPGCQPIGFQESYRAGVPLRRAGFIDHDDGRRPLTRPLVERGVD